MDDMFGKRNRIFGWKSPAGALLEPAWPQLSAKTDPKPVFLSIGSILERFWKDFVRILEGVWIEFGCFFEIAVLNISM